MDQIEPLACPLDAGLDGGFDHLLRFPIGAFEDDRFAVCAREQAPAAVGRPVHRAAGSVPGRRFPGLAGKHFPVRGRLVALTLVGQNHDLVELLEQPIREAVDREGFVVAGQEAGDLDQPQDLLRDDVGQQPAAHQLGRGRFEELPFEPFLP